MLQSANTDTVLSPVDVSIRTKAPAWLFLH